MKTHIYVMAALLVAPVPGMAQPGGPPGGGQHRPGGPGGNGPGGGPGAGQGGGQVRPPQQGQPPRPGTGSPSRPPNTGRPPENARPPQNGGQPPRPGQPQRPPQGHRPPPQHRPGAGRPPSFRPIHGPSFRYPRGYGYRRWSVGLLLPSIFLGSAYIYSQYGNLGVGAPPPGHYWVRYGPDLLLVNRRSRRIVDVIYGAFY